MGQSVQLWLDGSQSEKMLGSETKAPPSVPLLLSIPRQFVHPSIADSSMDAEEGLGAELSGFQGGVSGPPAPQAGKLRLRKEPSRPLPQTTTYSTTSTSPQQSKAMSRLENLNQCGENLLCFITEATYILVVGTLKSTDLPAICGAGQASGLP